MVPVCLENLCFPVVGVCINGLKELLNPQGRRPPVVDPGPSEYGERNYRTATFGEAPGRVIVPKSTRRGIYISLSDAVKLTGRRVDVDYAMGHSSSRPY